MVSRTSHGEAQEYQNNSLTYVLNLWSRERPMERLRSTENINLGLLLSGDCVPHTRERVHMDPVTYVTHACLEVGATQGKGGWGNCKQDGNSTARCEDEKGKDCHMARSTDDRLIRSGLWDWRSGKPHVQCGAKRKGRVIMNRLTLVGVCFLRCISQPQLADHNKTREHTGVL